MSNRNGEPWSLREIEWLKAHPDMSSKDMAAKLQRTLHAVRRMRTILRSSATGNIPRR